MHHISYSLTNTIQYIQRNLITLHHVRHIMGIRNHICWLENWGMLLSAAIRSVFNLTYIHLMHDDGWDYIKKKTWKCSRVCSVPQFIFLHPFIIYTQNQIMEVYKKYSSLGSFSSFISHRTARYADNLCLTIDQRAEDVHACGPQI